ncbi:MAG: hypothetical protein L7F78_24610 [Syntrophales bacterium LBB04]|nr:hypothetical protein [Syntrophales bacterium LBB04]
MWKKFPEWFIAKDATSVFFGSGFDVKVSSGSFRAKVTGIWQKQKMAKDKFEETLRKLEDIVRRMGTVYMRGNLLRFLKRG